MSKIHTLIFTLLFLTTSCKREKIDIVGQWYIHDIVMTFDDDFDKSQKESMLQDLEMSKVMMQNTSNFIFGDDGWYRAEIAKNVSEGHYKFIESNKAIEIDIKDKVSNEILKDTFDIFLKDTLLTMRQSTPFGSLDLKLSKGRK